MHIKSVPELFNKFTTQETCVKYLEEIIWKDKPLSPFDINSEIYSFKNGKYKCKATGKYFNVMHGTMFENTEIELQKWFYAIWLITSHKKGIASTQLAKEINVTQKTAWFMQQRIRHCFFVENNNMLEGIIEADESFYGGKNINRHRDKKVKNNQGRSFKDKTPVFGMIARGGKMTAIVTKNTSKNSLQKLIKKFVKPESIFISDDWKGYIGLDSEYSHYTVKHSGNKYVNMHDPFYHTNHIEGAWKIMKNSLRDMYSFVSKKHLQVYVDEFVYRYNMRNLEQSDRFNWLVLNSGIRTTYKNLVKQK